MTSAPRIRPALALAVCAGLIAAPAAAADPAVIVRPLATISVGSFDEGATEIIAFDAGSRTLYSINGETSALDILDLSDPAAPVVTRSVPVDGTPTSVAVGNGIVAVSVSAEAPDAPGHVDFLDLAGELLAEVEVGVDPDHVIFTPDGMKALTADEGEPAEDYSVDAPGSVTVIDLAQGVENATTTILGFEDFNADGSRAGELAEGVLIYGPGSSVAQDLEPEFAAVSPDGTTAWVTLQENNAVAVVDLVAPAITAILPLGVKDLSLPGNGIDAGDEDGAIDIRPRAAVALYRPDQIAAWMSGDALYLITTNEGDTRDFDAYSEETEVGEVTLDPTVFPDAAAIQAEGDTGKLEITTAYGDTDGDGDYDVLAASGARSFAIWDAATGALVHESGDLLEQTVAERNPEHFNSTHDEQPSFEDRSDNAGPEPEGIALGRLGDHDLAFIGAERQSGIFVVDVTDPTAPSLIDYVENRDWSGVPADGTAGDLGPEALVFIPAEAGPDGRALLVVANEVSGTISVWEVVEG